MIRSSKEYVPGFASITLKRNDCNVYRVADPSLKMDYGQTNCQADNQNNDIMRRISGH